jgi:alpha-glucosidase (family GH31 glycosyl hydrolase)
MMVLALGCSDLPPRWTLTAPGVTVEIDRAPYRFHVRDGGGRAVLDSLGDGARDGWSSVGWTTGHVAWNPLASKGYYDFATGFDPWRDHWEVTAATGKGPTRLDVTLEGGDGECVKLSHQLRDSTLRVEAQPCGKPPRAWSAGFASPVDEAFVGFGERFNRVDQRGRSLYSWPEEGGLSEGEKSLASATNPWPNGEGMTYYPVPFFVSTRGYGFWLDTTWRNQFDLATDKPDAWRVWSIGPSIAYEVYLPIPGDTRPWPQQIVDLFTAKTGRPMVPPAWSFGPRRRIGRSLDELHNMRDQGLAVTVVDENTHFAPDGDDMGKEAQLAAYTQAAAQLGVRVTGYYNPYFSTADTNPLKPEVDRALAANWFLRDGSGAPSVVWLISGGPVDVYTVDVTSADANNWFTGTFNRALTLGYRGWMYDFGEYVQPDVVAANGMTGEEFHNLFPVLYQKAAHDALEAGPLAGDWYYYARSGYTGSTQWAPMVWGGDPDASFSDAEGVPAVVRAGINMGWSGVAHWGSDIGGFKCEADGSAAADGELLARWIELGSMSSNMHDEDACSGGSGPKATIWTSSDARTAWRTYAGLHTRLLPYFTALAVEAHATGAPVIRSLFFEHPDQPELARVDDAYYLGPSLLVAPVVKRGARDKTITLPSGMFLDWRDLSLHPGGATVTLPAPLTELPLLLRDGQLVPLLDPSVQTLDPGPHPGVIGPNEVADVYDVVGFISTATGGARFTLADGSVLRASWNGFFAAPDGVAAAVSEAELATCDRCWLSALLPTRVRRVRVSAPAGDVSAAGLTLHADGTRRIRWDLFLAE